MKLEDIKRIADTRTKGEWVSLTNHVQHVQKTDRGENIKVFVWDDEALPNDMKFIAMAANNIDVLLEIAMRVMERHEHEFEDLLENLED